MARAPRVPTLPESAHELAPPLSIEGQAGFDDADAAALASCWRGQTGEHAKAFARACGLPFAEPSGAPKDHKALREAFADWMESFFLHTRHTVFVDACHTLARACLATRIPVRQLWQALTLSTRQYAQDSSRVEASEHDTRRALARAMSYTLTLLMSVPDHLGDRARWEERLLAHLPIAALVIDRDNRVLFATSSPLWSSPQATSRPLASDVIPPALWSAPIFQSHLAVARDTGEPAVTPHIGIRRQGHRHAYGAKLTPLTDGQILIHLEDLTEVVRAEARLQQAESMAQLGALSASVAHELRNPLAGISGVLQVMARTFPDQDNQRLMMGKLVQQIEALDRMVSDLMGLAKPSIPAALIIDLRQVVESVLELARPKFEHLHVTVQGHGTALADGDQVNRIVFNLLTNAAHAMSGSGRVTIRIDEGLIEVQDEGPGVPEQLVHKIFEPFVSTKSDGRGLGLAISRGNARAIGGEVSLTSNGPRGACFQLSLPRASIPAEYFAPE